MRIPFHTSFTIAALSFFLSACSDSFTDARDGQSYDVVKIGEQTWMAENLNYATEAKTVCPEGWRLPTKSDFALFLAHPHDDNLGVVSNKVGAKLKSRDGWFKKGNGTDEFGFNALPAGYRGAILKADDGAITGGKFDGIGGYAYFWSATEDSENPESNAYYLFLSFSSDAASLNAFAKEDFRSVRCVR